LRAGLGQGGEPDALQLLASPVRVAAGPQRSTPRSALPAGGPGGRLGGRMSANAGLGAAAVEEAGAAAALAGVERDVAHLQVEREVESHASGVGGSAFGATACDGHCQRRPARSSGAQQLQASAVAGEVKPCPGDCSPCCTPKTFTNVDRLLAACTQDQVQALRTELGVELGKLRREWEAAVDEAGKRHAEAAAEAAGRETRLRAMK
jgi:hypothetical protein